MDDMSLELTTILSELNEQSLNLFAEHQRKATILEADLKVKRREQEQCHEERILSIIMSFMNEVAGHTPSQTPTHSMPHYVPPIFSHTHTHPPSNQYPLLLPILPLISISRLLVTPFHHQTCIT